MKEKIHPKYGKCLVTCACGNSFVTGSTHSKIHVEVCSACHPFYTGKKRLVDDAGRVERFEKIMAKTEKMRQKPQPQQSKNKTKNKRGKK